MREILAFQVKYFKRPLDLDYSLEDSQNLEDVVHTLRAYSSERI